MPSYEEEAETEEEPEVTPPRTVIFDEIDNDQEVREKTEREKIKEDQRTKPAKERLGRRLPDKDGRPHVYDRLRTPLRETNSD